MSLYQETANTSLTGHVSVIRRGKTNTFVVLAQGLNRIQCIFRSQMVPSNLTEQSYIQVSGSITPLPDGKTSEGLTVELHVTRCIVLSECPTDYNTKCPATAGPELRLSERHFFIRNNMFALTTCIRGALVESIRHYFKRSSCTEIFPPTFTGVECEGGATLFKLLHPGIHSDKPMNAYLTQSSQFALEMALPGVGDCYCIAPSFRAENSHTRRHLTEFLHAEAEWENITTIEQHVEKLKDMVICILDRLYTKHIHLLERYGVDERVKDLRIKCADGITMTHREAIEECRRLGINKDDGSPFGDRDDIPEAQERQLIDTLDKIVFLTRFPEEFKSFYMLQDPENPSLVLGCDVEVPGVGEIIGSGIREYNHDRLLSRMLKQGLVAEDYREYLDLRTYGHSKTSGMGLGVDRMLTWILDANSIRDVVTFPRFPGYLRP
jgi:asparaginyl-tRNA synthetase